MLSHSFNPDCSQVLLIVCSSISGLEILEPHLQNAEHSPKQLKAMGTVLDYIQYHVKRNVKCGPVYLEY